MNVTIEPDRPPRTSEFHKRVVSTEPIPGTQSGHKCRLECGHEIFTFGSLLHLNGVALCMQCRDERVTDHL